MYALFLVNFALYAQIVQQFSFDFISRFNNPIYSIIEIKTHNEQTLNNTKCNRYFVKDEKFDSKIYLNTHRGNSIF